MINFELKPFLVSLRTLSFLIVPINNVRTIFLYTFNLY